AERFQKLRRIGSHGRSSFPLFPRRRRFPTNEPRFFAGTVDFSGSRPRAFMVAFRRSLPAEPAQLGLHLEQALLPGRDAGFGLDPSPDSDLGAGLGLCEKSSELGVGREGRATARLEQRHLLVAGLGADFDSQPEPHRLQPGATLTVELLGLVAVGTQTV